VSTNESDESSTNVNSDDDLEKQHAALQKAIDELKQKMAKDARGKSSDGKTQDFGKFAPIDMVVKLANGGADNVDVNSTDSKGTLSKMTATDGSDLTSGSGVGCADSGRSGSHRNLTSLEVMDLTKYVKDCIFPRVKIVDPQYLLKGKRTVLNRCFNRLGYGESKENQEELRPHAMQVIATAISQRKHYTVQKMKTTYIGNYFMDSNEGDTCCFDS
jgi:hypothetical protein